MGPAIGTHTIDEFQWKTYHLANIMYFVLFMIFIEKNLCQWSLSSLNRRNPENVSNVSYLLKADDDY